MTQAPLSVDRIRRAVSALPTTRHEDWKYTDLSSAIDISTRWLQEDVSRAPDAASPQAIAALTAAVDADWIVIENGVPDPSSFPEGGDIGIERLRHAEALADDPLARLNSALQRDALRIEINAATEKPLGILIIDEALSGAQVSQATIDIEVAPGCDAEIIEYHSSSGDGDHYSNSAVTLHIGESAKAAYVRIQDRDLKHVQTARFAIELDTDSELQMAGYDLGGGLIRNDVDVNLAKPGASANFNGLYLAGDDQHIDNHTRVDHRVGPASSSQEYRGILNGRCRCVWNGKAVVHEGADGTDARQANHNLLLSDKAEIDAKPELEIYADDVKCAHGTTVGQLDEAAIFYLRTRGLDQRAAQQLLTHAFAAGFVNRAPVAASREAVTALVEARLSTLVREAIS